MHILLTNDDGPPSPQSSPYVRCLVKELQKAGHTVSVCLPHTQRSWISKAHMVGQSLKPLYYQPSDKLHGEGSEGTIHHLPSQSGSVEEWILVDGTPASCVQIGLHHLFRGEGPVDLVLSGPNYGRNTTAVFALSSGTLGGALEAAVCRRRAVALSFAFFSRNHDPDVIEAACRHSVRVVEALCRQWPADDSVDLYSVNVPLVEGVEGRRTLWTALLQNYWREGSCFQEVEPDDSDAGEAEEQIREVGEAGMAVNGGEAEPKTGHKHVHFRWAPKFSDVYKSVEEAPPGNDGWAVKEGYTSVTPLKANYWNASPHLHQKELVLPERPETTEASEIEKGLVVRAHALADSSPRHRVSALVDYEDPYVQPLILDALKEVFPKVEWDFLSLSSARLKDGEVSLAKVVSDEDTKILQISQYEAIDFEFAASHLPMCLVNSYVIRKALIRKHFLSAMVEQWVAKHPDSVLKNHFRRSEIFEVDYAEFLDDALVEAWDLRESMEKNSGAGSGSVEEEDSEAARSARPAEEREWWILKPGMSDRAQGIKLFSTMDELQEIFDAWDAALPESGDEEDGDDNDGAGGHQNPDNAEAHDRDYINTAHLRHFVAQPYIHPPLLVPGDGRKFHIRAYVLCTGSLRVHVYRHMLALFAGRPYEAPRAAADLDAHLTNTCLQGESASGDASVQRFWNLALPEATKEAVFAQICAAAGEVFEAAARGMGLYFQTVPNAFEVFGLDFLVDAGGSAFLLEVNAFPDFRQTGDGLRDVVAMLWKGVLRLAVGPFFGLETEETREGGAREDGAGRGDMVLVREVDLGRR